MIFDWTEEQRIALRIHDRVEYRNSRNRGAYGTVAMLPNDAAGFWIVKLEFASDNGNNTQATVGLHRCNPETVTRNSN